MASGNLGQQTITTNGTTDVYTVPAETVASFSILYRIRMHNSNNDVRISVGGYDLYDVDDASQFVAGEFTGIVAGPGESVSVSLDRGHANDEVIIRVHGFEEGQNGS